MNPQIRELAEQSGIPTIEGKWDYNDRNLLVKDGGEWRATQPSEIISTMIQSERGLEKFAELIIDECCQYLNNEIDRLNQYRAALESEPQRNEIFIAEIDVCIDKCQDNILGLREHFGIDNS